MTIRQLDTTDLQKIADAVADAERKTSAEVVAAVMPRSGSYRDVALVAAAIGTVVVLLFAVYNPWIVHAPGLLVLELAGAFVALYLLFSLKALARLVAPRPRQARQVIDAARAMFVEQNVHTTEQATGVLVYVSALERMVVVIADTGVEAAVEAEAWETFVEQLQPLARQPDAVAGLVACVERVGEYLAEPLPAGEDDVNELPDLPEGFEA